MSIVGFTVITLFAATLANGGHWLESAVALLVAFYET